MTVDLQPLTGAYEEVILGPELIARICPLERCSDPLCDCRIQPRALFLYSDVESDAWVAGRVLPEASMDDLIAAVSGDEEVLRQMLVNSILFGCGWTHFVGEKMSTLVDRQQVAFVEIPSWYWTRPIEELRRLRGSLYEVDPGPVMELLKMAWFWAFCENGGNRGLPG